MYQIQLNSDVRNYIQRPVRGQGGFQTLLRRLQKRTNMSDGILTLSHEDVEVLQKYYSDFGQGGFQNRIKWILDRVEIEHT